VKTEGKSAEMWGYKKNNSDAWREIRRKTRNRTILSKREKKKKKIDSGKAQDLSIEMLRTAE
jgi:hypothetical protein